MTLRSSLPAPSREAEVDHRLANSLQLLSSLVAAQTRAVTDPVGRAALEMTQRRIGAVASVHRQLCLDQDAERVELGKYLAELCQDLELGCADAGRGRHVRVSTERVWISAGQATSIGIIVSELVTNACKHAYLDGDPGEVRVVLHAMPFGGYRVIVSDRGAGAWDRTAGSGLGMRLIEAMVAKLDGICFWNNGSPGTVFTLDVRDER